jgi:hypothetical protein
MLTPLSDIPPGAQMPSVPPRKECPLWTSSLTRALQPAVTGQDAARDASDEGIRPRYAKPHYD